MAVAYGCAAALVMEAVVMGASVTAAVAEAADWLQRAAHGSGPAGAANAAAAGADGGARSVPAALWGEVAARLQQAAQLAPLAPLEAATRLGRNCHLPNSLQTPLQVLLHLEQRQEAKLQTETLATEGGGTLHQAAADAQQSCVPVKQRADTTQDFCLPCSMGQSSVCQLPSLVTPATGASPATRASQQQARQATPATLSGAASFVEAVRLALR